MWANHHGTEVKGRHALPSVTGYSGNRLQLLLKIWLVVGWNTYRLRFEKLKRHEWVFHSCQSCSNLPQVFFTTAAAAADPAWESLLRSPGTFSCIDCIRLEGGRALKKGGTATLICRSNDSAWFWTVRIISDVIAYILRLVRCSACAWTLPHPALLQSKQIFLH